MTQKRGAQTTEITNLEDCLVEMAGLVPTELASTMQSESAKNMLKGYGDFSHHSPCLL